VEAEVGAHQHFPTGAPSHGLQTVRERVVAQERDLPPATSSRCASRSQTCGSHQMAAPYSLIAKSKLPSGNGVASALPWCSVRSTPCARASRRAVASCASLTSTPVQTAPRRAIHALT
jgi:hypothetical protein